MRKATLVYLCATLLLSGAVVHLTFSYARTNIQAGQAGVMEFTQGSGIIWNNTDYNAIIAQNAYHGPQTLSPRITVEYGDFVTMNNLTSGVPNFQVLPRIIMEYADEASQFGMQTPQGLNQTLAPRIIVEYADYVSYMAFPLQPYPGPFPHDVAVLNVSSSKTVVGQTYNCSVNVTVSNNGYFPEIFNVTVYANTTMIGTQTVDNILNGTSTALAFAWNTTGFAYGNYTLWAYAEPVLNETNTANNNYTCSTPVHVGVPDDVSSIVLGVYDGICNMRDINYLILHFNSKPDSPNWNPNTDINDDGVCNMRDIVIAILNFNKRE